MVFIFSRKEDLATNAVIRWLEHLNVNYQRINSEEDQEAIQLLYEHLVGYSVWKGAPAKRQEHFSLWFRRPNPGLLAGLAGKEIDTKSIRFPTFKIHSRLLESLKNNYRHYLRNYFHHQLNYCNLGSYHKTTVNKLEVLETAVQVGLKIPETVVTNDMEVLKPFFEKHQRDIICKTLFEAIHPLGVREEGFTIRCMTERIEDLAVLPEVFFPSLFQENIQKRFEIRVFFIRDKCYAAAMFTQQHADTITDFRNQNDQEIRTRVVPYQLDEEMEQKLRDLMREIGINSGSIDLIKGKDDNYHFLEVNPVGMYGFISTPCNYDLDEVIARELIAIGYEKN